MRVYIQLVPELVFQLKRIWGGNLGKLSSLVCCASAGRGKKSGVSEEWRFRTVTFDARYH